ncbi:MAG: hypothetical protein JWM89_2196 [Acidimicrobiales bacterium]|nr:hypothetical protein [Acidimicrobiales bacterium]
MGGDGSDADPIVERLGEDRAQAIEAELEGTGVMLIPVSLYERLMIESARYRRLAALAAGEDPE